MKFHWLLFLVTLLLAETVARARGAPDETAALAVLSSDAGVYEKAMACNDLAVVGTAKAVPALANLLSDEKLHDYARNGLELIDDPSAGSALLDALKRLKGSQLTGVVNTLGDRKEKAAVPALQKMATDPDNDAANAALSSLGLIATDEAAKTIIELLKDGSADVKVAAANAALVAARRRAEEGRPATALLDAVRRADVPAHVKAAAVAKK